ncbi:hypothetical protein BDZ45DRAFT_749997 [Acephala macrosclerotiorum]|nr:hypothetical protein BDZ45DRAFT_749997 [Acephala macrosclerotiorum]
MNSTTATLDFYATNFPILRSLYTSNRYLDYQLSCGSLSRSSPSSHVVRKYGESVMFKEEVAAFDTPILNMTLLSSHTIIWLKWRKVVNRPPIRDIENTLFNAMKYRRLMKVKKPYLCGYIGGRYCTEQELEEIEESLTVLYEKMATKVPGLKTPEIFFMATLPSYI